MGKAREMNRFLLPGVLFSFPLLLSAAVFQVDKIDFHFTLPPVNNGTARIMSYSEGATGRETKLCELIVLIHLPGNTI